MANIKTESEYITPKTLTALLDAMQCRIAELAIHSAKGINGEHLTEHVQELQSSLDGIRGHMRELKEILKGVIESSVELAKVAGVDQVPDVKAAILSMTEKLRL